MSAIAQCCTVEQDLCNTAMQFFKVKLTRSLFYNHLFYAQLISVHADKRYVFKWIYLRFYNLLCQINTHLPQLYRDLFFADVSHVLVMFRHDFGQGGRVPWSPCLREEHGR